MEEERRKKEEQERREEEQRRLQEEDEQKQFEIEEQRLLKIYEDEQRRLEQAQQQPEIYIEQSSYTQEDMPKVQIEMLDASLMSSHLEEQFQFKNSEIKSPSNEFYEICDKLQTSTYDNNRN